LQITKVELKSIAEPETRLFIENVMRGGISTTTNHYARTNYLYLKLKRHGGTQSYFCLFKLDAKHFVRMGDLKLSFMSLGVKLLSIPRVATFQQKPWLKTYDDVSTGCASR
jgi:hypothetical protein